MPARMSRAIRSLAGSAPYGGNESGDRPPAFCHQDLLSVLDAEQVS